MKCLIKIGVAIATAAAVLVPGLPVAPQPHPTQPYVSVNAYLKHLQQRGYSLSEINLAQLVNQGFERCEDADAVAGDRTLYRERLSTLADARTWSTPAYLAEYRQLKDYSIEAFQHLCPRHYDMLRCSAKQNACVL